MSSLRVAFVQTYPSGNPYLYFLSSISFLLSSIQDTSTHSPDTSLSQKMNKLATKFQKGNSILKESKDRSTWLESLPKSSLIQISNHDLTDFQTTRERSDFVHALELISEEFEETSDIITVKSEEINFGQLDPHSTQISQQSDMDLSQIDDF